MMRISKKPLVCYAMAVKRFLPAYGAALMACLSLSSCDGEVAVPVMECVPKNAVVVKAVDLAALFKEAGCPSAVSSDTLRAGADKVLELTVAPALHAAVAKVLVAGGVDISETVCFTDASGGEVVAMPVVDRGALVEGLNRDAIDGRFMWDEDGFEYSLLGHSVVALGLGNCFIASDLSTVRGFLERNGDIGLSGIPGIKDFLLSAPAMKIAVNCGRSSLSYLGNYSKWLCVGVDVSSASVAAQAVVMDGRGRLDSIGRHFEVIDPAFLRYTPADAAFVIAFGRFSGNERGLSMLLGRFAPMYCRSADGTTSLYALPAGGAKAVADGVSGAWNVETMVHFPDSLVHDCINQYILHADGAAYRIGNQWMYNDGDENYFFGVFDSAVVFSVNREISQYYNNSFYEDFSDRRAAMVVDIPVGGVLADAWSLPYGFTFKVGVDAMRVKARITFNGTGGKALELLLKLPQLPDYHARLKALTGQ